MTYSSHLEKVGFPGEVASNPGRRIGRSRPLADGDMVPFAGELFL